MQDRPATARAAGSRAGWSVSASPEQQAPCQRTAARRNHGDLVSAAQLPGAGAVLELQHGFVQEAQPVQSPAGQLPALGAQGERAVAHNGASLVEERADFTAAAEAERFQSDEGQEAESVVEFGEVHIGRGQVGA